MNLRELGCAPDMLTGFLAVGTFPGSVLRIASLEEVTRVLVAWANLYISIRMAAPSLEDISKAYVE